MSVWCCLFRSYEKLIFFPLDNFFSFDELDTKMVSYVSKLLNKLMRQPFVIDSHLYDEKKKLKERFTKRIVMAATTITTAATASVIAAEWQNHHQFFALLFSHYMHQFSELHNHFLSCRMIHFELEKSKKNEITSKLFEITR